MTNGTNRYGISFAQITWFERLLNGHDNVVVAVRHDDIVWDVTRNHGRSIQAICIDEYTCGIARALEVREAYPALNLIYVGGVWNGYTIEAKEYCISSDIGLFNTREMTGALYKDDFWNYHRKDKDGNPIYG